MMGYAEGGEGCIAMDNTADSIMLAARELFVAGSYDSMSVSSICTKAHVSRSTFYSRFEDKEDLFRKIVRADFVDQLRKIRSTLPRSIALKKKMGCDSSLLNEWTYHGFLENKAFYEKLNKEESLLLQNALVSSICNLNSEVIKDYQLDDDEREYMVYFFAANHAMLIMKWISDGMRVDAKELSAWYYKWSTRYWSELAAKQLPDNPE